MTFRDMMPWSKRRKAVAADVKIDVTESTLTIRGEQARTLWPEN